MLQDTLKKIAVLLLLLPGIVQAEAAAETDEWDNEYFIIDALRQHLVEELPDSLRALPLRVESNLPENKQRIIVESLVAEGLALKTREAENAFLLEFEIQPQLYLERFSRSRAERVLEMEYSLHVIDADDTIRETYRSNINRADTVAYRNRENLVTEWPATRFADVNDTTRWRWISGAAEPAILIGATAVAVALLYNVRS